MTTQQTPGGTAPQADIVDLLAGIAPGSRLDAVRAQRPQARENAQRSFAALLEPAEPGAFPLGERYAVAAFVADLHGFDRAAEFYADLLADEDPALVGVVAAAAADGASSGPYGVYREPGLARESASGPAWSAPADDLGPRLAAAFTHAHLLVFRPREASAAAIRALVEAGWSADDIVTLSQLVSFLSFQLRLAWGLRALDQNPATGHETAGSATTEGAVR
ncbi:CMD domain protein [Microbacterium sp. NPDC096154]|uniref:CMD domain protein n=1 Tax=Microbacterium sp. NPDC096154 TaxID=3155549 RepID=UPI00333295B3